jgi:hypothetical protein
VPGSRVDLRHTFRCQLAEVEVVAVHNARVRPGSAAA